MKSHASMNRIYRLIWSQVLNTWVAVAENARGKGKGTSRQLAAVALSLSTAFVQAAPLGGQVASGTGSISQSGATTTIQQSSQNLSLNWQSFNVAAQETVNFAQPSASAIAVNRIYDTNGSQILGHLNANGQVYLINPNGVLFGQGAQVNVGGLVASTLDLNATQNGNTRSFSGSGTGSVVNQGTLNATNGGYVALLGNKVSNQGVISAQLGSVALGAGSAATLTFNGNSLLHMQVDQSTLNNLAENRQLIQANGGQVIMSAGAKDALLASVVNNSGIIEARTVDNHEGVITLLGGMKAGTVNVGGTLDASAPNGGNGGQIETSAAHVKVTNNAKVTTTATNGRYGNWLIDPQDFTVAASGGDMTGLTLSTSLGTTPVTLQSSSGGTAGSGNIDINDAVNWSANTTLTLTASNNITIKSNITATGNTAGLALNPNTANGAETASGTGAYSLNSGASITLSGTNPSLSIGGTAYTVINDVNALQAMNSNLAGHYVLGSNIDASSTSSWNAGAGFVPLGAAQTSRCTSSCTYVLGSLLYSGTVIYTDNYFHGVFDGFNHTITGLTINRPSSRNVGLFGYVAGGKIANVGLVNENIIGSSYVGGLVGTSAAYVQDSATATNGGDSYYSYGHSVSSAVRSSYSNGAVAGTSYVGGLIGSNAGSVVDSYFIGGSVSANNTAYSGGLVGFNSGNISNSHYDLDTVTVNGSHAFGTYGFYDTQFQNWVSHGLTLDIANFGASLAYDAASGFYLVDGLQGMKDLIGFADVSGYKFRLTGNVDLVSTPGYYIPSFSAAELDGAGNVVSNLSLNPSSGSRLGLIGTLNGGTIENLGVQDVLINGGSYSGGLVGYNNLGTIRNSYSSGTVSSTVSGLAGGLVGYSVGGIISDSNSSAAVTSSSTAGGLVGVNSGIIRNSHASGNVTVTSGNSSSYGGGLIGSNNIGGDVSNSYSSGTVTVNLGASYAYSGGFVGSNSGGTIRDSYSTGNVTEAGDRNYIWMYAGGFAGYNAAAGDIGTSYSSGAVTVNTTGSPVGIYAGGFAGYNTSAAIHDSYSTGSVTANANNVSSINGLPTQSPFGIMVPPIDAGGLVGHNGPSTIATGSDSNSIVSGSYSTGAVAINVTGTYASPSHAGGLVGNNLGQVSNSYWNSDSNANGIGSGTAIGATGLAATQMQTASNFAGFNFTTTPGATGNNWVMVDADGSLNNANGATGSTRPMLASEYSTTIGNSHQLQLMAMKLSASYTLAQNIDAAATASGKDVWGSDGFVPIGKSGFGWDNFTGMFDGQGHTISNLTINRPSDAYVGLFGYISVDATVQNVGMLGGSMQGDYDVGMLAGQNRGTISNAYATGSVSGGQGVGGLVGENYGTISDAHATGSVSGTTVVGGLVGYNYGAVSNAYASGSVTGNSEVGGLAGYNYGGTFSNAFYDIDQVSINGGSLLTAGGIYHAQYQDWISHGQTLDLANYASLPAGDGGYYNVSSIQGLKDMLGFAENPAVSFRLTGNIDLSSVPNFYIPYFSGTFDGNNNVISNLLINNIPNSTLGMFGQLSGSVTKLGVENANISGGNRYIGGLAGKNDGTISNSHVTGSVNGYLSVGGMVGENDGTVSDAYATNSVNGTYAVGGLVGSNYGTISNAHATGSVTGYSSVGGLAGESVGGTIGNAYATGSVSGGENVGGLVGQNYFGLIDNAYATGNVIGGAEVGGLVGSHSGLISNAYATGDVTGSGYDVGGLAGNNLGTIENTYATGRVSGDSNVGGLIGEFGQGTISNSFWNSDVNAVGIGSGIVTGTTGLTTAQMQTQSSFAGLDFANTWVMYEGHTYPLLRSFMTPLTVTAKDAVKTYDGQAYSGGNGVTYSSTPNGNLLGTVSYSGTSQGAVNANTYGITPGGLYSNQQGYILGYVNGTLTVNPANISVIGTTITVTGTVANNKVYDGTTNATLTGGTLVGVIAGDALTLNQSGYFATKNVGSNIAVTATDSLGGTVAGNYTLIQPTGLAANITPASLTVAGTTVGNKVYDGTTTATLAGGTLSGVIAGDTVTLNQTGTFATKNVGTHIAVTAIDSLGGDSAGNYTLTAPTSLAANITPKSITVAATGVNKVYDGTVIDPATLSSAGVISGDMVNLGYASASFANKNVGANKKVSVTGINATGEDAGNYSLGNTSASTSASITPATLVVTGTKAHNKLYDGKLTAWLTGGKLSGVIAGDTVKLKQSGTFATKDVGTGIAVAATDRLLGAAAGNYTLTEPTGLAANIMPNPFKAKATKVN